MSVFKIFAGSQSTGLAAGIAAELRVPLGARRIERFPDGETAVRIEESVCNCEVFFVQSTSPPVNDALVELLVFADACRRASARSITVIVPYFGYPRSDKRHGRREPITASMVAGLMEAVGIDHVVTVDLHAAQIEGFFHVPVDSLKSVPVLCHALERTLQDEVVVVSPDAGRVKTATEYAERLEVPVVVLHKDRTSGTQTTVRKIVGEVRGRPCLVIDDMVSTGGTLAESVKALLEAGAAEEITIAVTHGLFLAGAPERLAAFPIREFWITDTIELPKVNTLPLRVASMVPMLAQEIRRLTEDLEAP